MVSEAKKAVFGIQVDERPAENQIQARSNIQNVLNLVGALIVVYVYVAFYAIPRYVLLKAVALAQTLLASNCASAYSAKAKGRYQELKNTWSPKLQSLLVRAQDYTLYTLAEKVYQKALVPAIQNLISVAHLIIEKVQVLLVRATQLVEWAFQTLSNVKQQVLASTLVVKGVQFSNTVATRALLIYETKLLALWAFAKQVVIGKLGKRFTIVEQKAEPVATVAPLQEEQRAEQVAAPIVPQQQPQESQPQQAEKVDAAPAAQEPVARKLQFEDEPAVEAKAEPSEEPIVKEAEVQEPLLQPAPASAPAHEEEQQDALSSPRKQDAADEAHDDQHLSPSKAKHGRKHKHTKKK